MRDRISQAVAMLVIWVRPRWWVVLIVVAAVAAVGLGIALSLYQLSQTEPLMRQADALSAGEMRLVRQREILQFQVDNLAKIWTTIVQAVVGVVLATGAVATWRNLRVTNEAQITNRFTQAISQLGAELTDGTPNLEVRLGGIYALERIARDSPRDHWTIMEILTAYVRKNRRSESSPSAGVVSSAEDAPPLRTDLQAILTVIGRRIRADDRGEPNRLDLHGTDLRRAEFYGAHFERADLRSADLGGARAGEGGVYLDKALLTKANLEWTRFGDARLVEAILDGANLKRASLRKADLQSASLINTNLEWTGFEDAHLEGAVFYGAQLNGTSFQRAHLDGAKLRGVDLQRAIGLDQKQVDSAANHGKDALSLPLPLPRTGRFQEPNEQASARPPVPPTP